MDMEVEKPKFFENYNDWMKRNNINKPDWFDMYRKSVLRREFVFLMVYFIGGFAYGYFLR